MTGAQWKAGALLGATGLGGAIAAALVTTMLLLAGVYTLGDLPEESQGLTSGWIAWIAQVTGMGFGNPLGGGARVDGGILGSIDASGALYLLPVVVPAAAVAAVLLLGRRVTGGVSLPRGATRAIVAATAGAVLALGVLLLPAALPISFAADESTSVTLRAVSFWGLLVAAATGFATAYRTLGAPGEPVLPPAWARGARQVVEHLGALSAVLGVALTVSLAVSLDDGVGALLLATPVVLPLLGAMGAAVTSWSALTAGGSFGSVLGGESASVSATMFSAELPGWVRVVLPLVGLLALLVAGVRWRARRGPAPRRTSDWVVLPVGYALGGLLLMALGTVSASFAGGGLADAAGAVGPAPWTFVVLAAVGLVVEVVARFVALPFLRVLPAGLAAAVVARVGGRAAVAQPAPVAVPTGVGPDTEGPTSGITPSDPAPQGPTSGITPSDPAPQAGPTPSEALPAGTPMSARAKRGWLVAGIGVAGIAVLAVAGTVVRNHLATTTYGPQPRAEAYLQALVDGDASTAVELLDPNVTSAERVLLSDEVYSASEGRPTGFEITDSEITGDTAHVEGTLTMDTKAHPVSFTLAKSGSQGLVFDDWRIVEGPTQQVTLAMVAGVPQVNGVQVDLSAFSTLPEGGELTALPVLPGSYTFAAPEGTEYHTYGEDQTVVAVPGSGAEQDLVGSEADPTLVSFVESWTPKAGEDAIAAAKKHVETCLASDALEPEGCPNTLDLMDWGYAVTDIERSWESAPEYTFDDGMSEGSNGEAAVIITGGDVSVDYKSRYDEEDEWEKDSDSQTSVFGGDWFSTRVPVTVGDDGELTLDFSDL